MRWIKKLKADVTLQFPNTDLNTFLNSHNDSLLLKYPCSESQIYVGTFIHTKHHCCSHSGGHHGTRLGCNLPFNQSIDGIFYHHFQCVGYNIYVFANLYLFTFCKKAIISSMHATLHISFLLFSPIPLLLFCLCTYILLLFTKVFAYDNEGTYRSFCWY